MIIEKTFSATDACKYLGIHKQSLEKHQRSGKLVYDYQFSNGERMYKLLTLEAYKARWQSPMLTQHEVADMFHVSEETVKYHFRRKRSITPDARRGSFGTYSDSKVLMIAKSEKWITGFSENSVGSERIGILRIHDSEKFFLFHRGNKVLSITSQYNTYEDALTALSRAVNQRRAQLLRNPEGHQLA